MGTIVTTRYFKFLVWPLLFLGIQQMAWAAVWKTTNSWDNNYQEKFKAWMRSTKVHERMFVDPASPYYGVRADCADAGYALRAIFSYENGLPFALVNPSGSRTRDSKFKLITNDTNSFDRVSAGNRRLVEFLNYIGSSVGSENLSRIDTYPIAINQISSTDFFTYKISGKFGKFIRHVYNIKNVNPIGTFDVIYSTQAIAEGKLPMIRRRERDFVNPPHDVWGFRRYKLPESLGRSNTHSLNRGYSEEQYDLAKKLGGGFFPYVKRTLAKISETPDAKIRRALTNVCEEATSRIDYVNQGVGKNAAIGGRCMNYTEFDTYSTPARDAALKKTFLTLKDNFLEVKRGAQLNQVDANKVALVNSIFFNGTASDRELLNDCAINYRSGVSIHLKELWRRIDRGLLSSHPNDRIELRWGETTSGKTKCQAHY